MMRAGEAEVPLDPRNPGDEYIQREIDNDRRGEWKLLPKTAIALAFVAVLVVIRQVYFS
jgi:hypothetical protein